MCFRFALRAFELAGRRPWFAFLILWFGLAIIFSLVNYQLNSDSYTTE